MKIKIPVILLAVLLLCTACAAPSSTEVYQEQSSPNGSDNLRMLTDSAGREVEVPAELTRVAVSGQLGQIIMLSMAPDLLIGISNPWDEAVREFLTEEVSRLPVLGQLYGTKGEMNLEELLAAKPQVVIDIGEFSDQVAQDMDALQEQTGIPFFHISSTLETTPETYRMLGEVLGRKQEAEELALYCEAVYQDALSLMDQVGDQKARILYCLGDQGLNVIAKGSYHAETLDMMADNLAVVDSPSSKGTGNEVDLEQILLWNPDIVLFAPNSIYHTLSEQGEWSNLEAISNGQYYAVPYGPYNWMGMPPSVQRYLGLIWAGHLLYPDQMEGELQPKVEEYFRLFYHHDLTQEQYDRLVTYSLPDDA